MRKEGAKLYLFYTYGPKLLVAVYDGAHWITDQVLDDVGDYSRVFNVTNEGNKALIYIQETNQKPLKLAYFNGTQTSGISTTKTEGYFSCGTTFQSKKFLFICDNDTYFVTTTDDVLFSSRSPLKLQGYPYGSIAYNSKIYLFSLHTEYQGPSFIFYITSTDGFTWSEQQKFPHAAGDIYSLSVIEFNGKLCFFWEEDRKNNYYSLLEGEHWEPKVQLPHPLTNIFRSIVYKGELYLFGYGWGYVTSKNLKDWSDVKLLKIDFQNGEPFPFSGEGVNLSGAIVSGEGSSSSSSTTTTTTEPTGKE